MPREQQISHCLKNPLPKSLPPHSFIVPFPTTMPAARPKKENNSATSPSDDVHLKDSQTENSKSKRKYVPNARSFSGLPLSPSLSFPLSLPRTSSSHVFPRRNRQLTISYVFYQASITEFVCSLASLALHSPFLPRLRCLQSTQGSLCQGESGRSQAVLQALYHSWYLLYIRLPAEKTRTA